MKVVCRSRAAAEWLALLDPEPGWLEPFNEEKPLVCDLLVLPGEIEPDGRSVDVLPVERQHGQGPGPRAGRVLIWAPHTLKSTLDHALRLARLTGRLPGLMALLAGREAELGKLTSYVAKLERPTGACLFFDGTWSVMGAWGPDLIDRAGGRPLLQDSGDPHVELIPGDVSRSRPDVLFLACDDMKIAEALLNGSGNPPAVSYLQRAYILPPDRMLYGGPSLHNLIFSMAAAFHPSAPGISVHPNPLRRIDLSD